MKYKLKNYTRDNGRIILTIETSQFFGIFKDQIEIIDSNKIYFYNNQTVWFILPNNKRIESGTKLSDFCNDCKHDIILKEK